MHDPREHCLSKRIHSSNTASGHDFTWARDALIVALPIPQLIIPLKRLFSSWTRTLSVLQRSQVAELHPRTESKTEAALMDSGDIRGQTFAHLFGAYRRFLQACCRCVDRTERPDPCLTSHSRLESLITTTLPSMAVACWTGDEMRMYRAIHQTLGRADGGYHHRLDPWKGRLRLEHGRLFVDALDNYRLYRALKINVEALVVAVTRHPKQNPDRLSPLACSVAYEI